MDVKLGGCEASVCGGLRTEPVPDLFCDQTQRDSLRTLHGTTPRALGGAEKQNGAGTWWDPTPSRAAFTQKTHSEGEGETGFKRRPGAG